MTNTNWEKEFIEAGAALEHDRWARWQKYLHSKCEPIEHQTDMPHCFCETVKEVQPNGDMVILHEKESPLTIPFGLVKRWERQITTPYAELSEEEKESDRKETRNYLPLVRTQIDLAFKAGERKGREDILNELQHDQRKLLDGFAHPKDCEMCHAGEVSKD